VGPRKRVLKRGGGDSPRKWAVSGDILILGQWACPDTLAVDILNDTRKEQRRCDLWLPVLYRLVTANITVKPNVVRAGPNWA